MISDKVNEVSAKAREIFMSSKVLAAMNEEQALAFYQMIVFRLLCENE